MGKLAADLVLKGFQCGLTHFLQILYKRLPAFRACPKRQRVHKHAEYRLKILVRPADNWRADDDIFLSA